MLKTELAVILTRLLGLSVIVHSASGVSFYLFRHCALTLLTSDGGGHYRPNPLGSIIEALPQVFTLLCGILVWWFALAIAKRIVN